MENTRNSLKYLEFYNITPWEKKATNGLGLKRFQILFHRDAMVFTANLFISEEFYPALPPPPRFVAGSHSLARKFLFSSPEEVVFGVT